MQHSRIQQITASPDERFVWALLALLCVASRAAMAIYYLADPDSLRFALSIVDYDLARLQPHFPGYPIFSFLVKGIDLFAGSFAFSFAVVGAVATVAIIAATLALLGERLQTLRGAIVTGLIFFNPMIWIMGERYMPDLLGLACALWSLHLLLAARNDPDDRRAMAGVLLAGLLAGIRLSYLPLLLLPFLDLLRRREDRLRLIVTGFASVAIWLLPLFLLTGAAPFFAAATAQTTGHFTEFGGTVGTEPDLLLRLTRFLGTLFTHGLGFYWAERHPLTILHTVALGAALIIGVSIHVGKLERRARLVLGSIALYILWIYLFQNVVHQPRHLLPIVAFLLMTIATGGVSMMKRSIPLRALFLAGLAGYSLVTSQLVEQHRAPTAIAQVTTYLRNRSTDRTEIVADPLVALMLQKQGVAGHYHEAESAGRDSVLATIPEASDLIVIGDAGSSDRQFRERHFFHNPYVNPVWPAITLHERE